MGKEYDLLDAVQSDEGWLAVIGIKGTQPAQRLVPNREEFDRAVGHLVANQYNVFFGVARYATNKNRTKENVLSLKALWLDIDCGPDKVQPDEKGKVKGYADQFIAADELKRFCAETNMPKPTVVNSGRGLHVYWPFTEAVTREQWEPAAAALRDLCVQHNLIVDSVVFEPARILRVPGTYNFKDDPPSEVTVVTIGPPTSFEELSAHLGVGLTFSGGHVPRAKSYLAEKMANNQVSSFAQIVARSEAGEGCAQILSCIRERAHLSEPRWFNALSVAKHCEDVDEALFLLSSGHPDYDPDRVRQKIEHIKSPHLCSTFELHNPGGCSDCPHKDKIKSPIALGKRLAVAEPEDNVIEEGGQIYRVPDLPKPYVRGKNGGIYIIPPDGEEGEVILVSELDFYIVKRMRDPELGDVVIARVHMPRDGVREFAIPNYKITDRTELRRVISAEGILFDNDKQLGRIMRYVVDSVSALQGRKRAELMRTQFGWADNDSKFIVGNVEITATGRYPSPPSKATAQVCNHMGTGGTLEKWKEVFALYGREGLEPVAFAALTAFGAPLLKFSGQNGAIINMIHPRSGTGKTTALHMCNSVWGHPKKLTGTHADSMVTKLHKFGVMNNLPLTYDEMTNVPALQLSEFVYSATQGKGKDRMKASSNELRDNNTEWQTMVLCSSNASFYEKLGALKGMADGENMRIIEFKVGHTNAIDTELAKRMFDHQLLNNYGHAGLIYGDYLVKNYEEVDRLYRSTQLDIDIKLGMQQSERNWSATLAGNFSGGILARRLGLLDDWNLQRIFRWAARMVVDLREDLPKLWSVSKPVEALGRYINANMGNIVVVDSQPGSFPKVDPRTTVLIRYEPDTKRMYIATSGFREMCVGLQINYRETMQELEKAGIVISKGVTKRLYTGGNHVTAPVNCIVVDTSAAEFGLEAIYVEKEEEQADG